MHISEKTWPKEASLQNLCLCLEHSSMASIHACMTLEHDIILFIRGNTPPQNAISTMFVQERLIPVVILDIMEELFFCW
jgi:hypothetical protein